MAIFDSLEVLQNEYACEPNEYVIKITVCNSMIIHMFACMCATYVSTHGCVNMHGVYVYQLFGQTVNPMQMEGVLPSHVCIQGACQGEQHQMSTVTTS